MTDPMPTREGDVVIMHDVHAAAPDQNVLWTALYGQQRPRNATPLVVKTGLDAATRFATLMAFVTGGTVYRLELDPLAWTTIVG